MLKSKIRIKFRLILMRILVIAVACGLLFFVVKLLDITIPKMENKELTKDEIIYKDYNTPIYGELEIEKEEMDAFVKLIDDFNNYANAKQYDKCYQLLDEEYKKEKCSNFEEFKLKIDEMYNKVKRYSYKNMSNIEGYYAYEITLFDDVMVYGSENELEERQYMYIIKQDEKGNYKLTLDGYVRTERSSYKISQSNVKMTLTKRDIYYDRCFVTINVENNTPHTFVYLIDDVFYKTIRKNKIKDYKYICYDLGYNADYVFANSTKDIEIQFNKRFDTEESKDYSIYFGNAYLINTDVVAGGYINREIIENRSVEKFDMQISF